MRPVFKTLICACLCVFASGVYASTVTGNVFLDNASDHSGIEIRFIPKSISAQEISGISLANGSYSVSVADGVYDIEYKKAGYQSISLFDVFINSNTSLTNRTLSSKPVVTVWGNVEGVWDKANVYRVTGNINVAAGRELVIPEGTLVQFVGYLQLSVHGKLTAIGTRQENIIFTSDKVSKQRGDWAGIVIYTAHSDSSKIEHAIVEYGGSQASETALIAVRGNAVVRNTVIRGGAYGGLMVFSAGALKAYYNEITNCYMYGFASSTSAMKSVFIGNKVHHNDLIGISNGGTTQIIKDNWVYNHGYSGIQTVGNPLIEGNVCFNNPAGISVTGNMPVLKSNTLIWNTNGIRLYDSDFWLPNPDITSNIIAFNTNYGIYCEGIFIPRKVEYNLIYGNGSGVANRGPVGLGQVVTNTDAGYPADTYKNIFLNPNFYSLEVGNPLFAYLSANSPAINSGDPAYKDADLTALDCGARPYLNNNPKPFKLHSPADLETIAVTPEVRFKWNRSKDIATVEYEMVIYAQDFIKKINAGTDSTATMNWQGTLKQNKVYSWYVIGRAGLSTSYSDTLEFTTPNLAPKPFTLESPANLVKIEVDDLNMNWGISADDDVLQYEIVLIAPDQSQKKLDAGTSRTLVVDWKNILDQNSTYSWFVVANDGAAVTHSDTLSFSTPNLPPTVFLTHAPLQNEEILTKQPLKFVWNRSFDDVPVTYQLSVKTEGFELTYKSLTDTTFVFDWIHILKIGDTYSWNVTASDGALVTVSNNASFVLPIVLSVGEMQSLSVWPNPFTNGFNVASGSRIERIEIINARGITVQQNAFMQDGFVDSNSLEPGMYLVRVFHTGNTMPTVCKMTKL
jgi:hypothetical protein